MKSYEELLNDRKYKTAIIDGLITLMDALIELENSKYAKEAIVTITISKKEN